ncbi:FkbM family methyltransferase [Pyrococcus horikoshii]|nr:FkbM family methyltransferase [Pyrococcus horikoshii]HII61029.1 FkbM family methyltransferase [Pyrococcus horikoshii]
MKSYYRLLGHYYLLLRFFKNLRDLGVSLLELENILGVIYWYLFKQKYSTRCRCCSELYINQTNINPYYFASACKLKKMGLPVEIRNSVFYYDGLEVYPTVIPYIARVIKYNWQVFNMKGNPMISFTVKNHDFKAVLLKGYEGLLQFYEQFILEQYGMFDYKDKTVIDIGGFIGDTALYFYSKEARKIVSFEPSKKNYTILIKNITLNNIKNVIPINAGVWDENTKGIITNPAPTAYRVKEESKGDVALVSILDIIDSYRPDIIKMDCEGCEYKVFEKLLETGYIYDVPEYVFEAHGNIKNELLSKLRSLDEFRLCVHSDLGNMAIVSLKKL